VKREQNGLSAYGPKTRNVIRWPSSDGCQPYRGGNG
jgi:hypothetical protein